MKKKIISLITALLMTVILIPETGLAVEGQTDSSVTQETESVQDVGIPTENESAEPQDEAVTAQDEAAAQEETTTQDEETVSVKAVAEPEKKVIKGIYTGKQPNFPNAISQQAIKLAWPYGTSSSKYTYPKVAAKKEYQEALQNAYGDRSGWGKQTKAGASCDVFVGTVVRSCGYDRKFQRGLEEDLKYLPGPKFNRINISKKNQFQPGDIIMYVNKSHGGHICVYVEINNVGYIAEASYSLKAYGRICRKACDWTPSKYKFFAVYRANSKCIGAIKRGDYSTDVKSLQQFLNWAGFNCGTQDGSFGEMTEKAVKAFQENEGLEADGEFGTGSYAAAKKYTNWGNWRMANGKNGTPVGAIVTSTSKPSTASAPAKTKKGYTGAWPTKTIKYKKGSKANVKKWQAFLRWYGYKNLKTDGKFGKGTKKYTKKFQKAMGLKADGVVGPKTIEKAKAVRK